MPAMETVAIINKSGKLVSTSKHLVNIFKDAKDAYQERKAEIKADHRARSEEKAAQKRLEALRLDDRLIEQRPRSHRGGSRHSVKHEDHALTEDNLSRVSGSVSGSRHGSRRGSKSVRSSHRSPPLYQAPYFEEADMSRPDLVRRHTEMPESPIVARRPSAPEFGPPARSFSSPNLGDEHIDMNLAYGDLPGEDPNPFDTIHPEEKQAELNGLMTKLDMMMMEAQCVQHSATTIISSLQKNPEAMAAVALTLAEISNLLTKMSPGIITALKSASPAVFALLASPQFLIAGGVAVGVTIVMFGGFKIIKRIQENKKEREEAGRMEEALAYEGDLSSIESWRRGIAEEQARSVATSVDGEFITPEAQRIRNERIAHRQREERRERRSGSVAGSSTSTIRRKAVPERTSSHSKSRLAEVETVVSAAASERSESTIRPVKKEKKEKKDRKPKAIEEKKGKKQNALAVLFKKQGESKKESSARKSHKQPLLIEM